MNCEDFGKYLDNYEGLTEREKTEMAEHAAVCEKCQAELDFFLSILGTVKSLPRIEPPSDFMERLNERLDAEEKKSPSSRIVYHVRRNWRQYATAAACFALVAVLTANGGVLVDQLDGGDDDGIIPVATTQVADNGEEGGNEAADANVTAETAETEPAAVQEEAREETEVSLGASQGQSTQRAQRNTAQTARTRTSQTTSSPAKTEVSAPSANEVSAGNSASEEKAGPVTSEAVQTETVTEVNVGASEEKAANTNKDIRSDYGIALAGSTRTTETAAASYDLRAEDVSASLSASEIRASYSLASTESGDESIALGRYYKIDRDGNPVDESREAKAIGSLKISSSDAEKAMEVIRKYPHSEDGDLYTTDSEYFSFMLSMLSTEGVSYTNYTPAGSGDVQFRIIFN